MRKYIYPVIFQCEEDGYTVFVPDFEEIITEGDTFEEAYDMAIDAMGLAINSRLEEGIALPVPSKLHAINLQENQDKALIGFDYDEYLKRTDYKAVKKTITLPSWLNKEAKKAGINFSQTLQEALKIKLEKIL